MAEIEPTPSKSECDWTPLSPYRSAKGVVYIGFINIILLGLYVSVPEFSTVLSDNIQLPDIFIIIAASPKILNIITKNILRIWY